MTNLRGHKMYCAIRFGFEDSNNKAEYEALLARLRLAQGLKVKGDHQARGPKMVAYLTRVKGYLVQLEGYNIEQIPSERNTHANALTKLASTKDGDILESIPLDYLSRPSITQAECSDDQQPKRIMDRPKYEIPKEWSSIDIQERGSECVDEEEAMKVLYEIHEGKCNNYASGPSKTRKSMRQGCYWPSMEKDANLINALPVRRGGAKYAVVAVDYFTKWVEEEPLIKIMAKKITTFVNKSIIYRYGIPYKIISDNDTQFEGDTFEEYCKEKGIRRSFSDVVLRQANGKVEAINKVLKKNLKMKLEKLKGAWVEELPYVLWTYKITLRSTTGETLFALAYGCEAVLLVEMKVKSFRIQAYEDQVNHAAIAKNLDMLEERRERAQLRVAVYQ
ncbi:uncharacterized protein LOC133779124 [Humulus lupulus]|uniref:uncharacterized protein LOC133779124 n=1 Tax=Humulus lupulus TaxID=3486 RepID=UPI002B400DD6|nr:uncharacterized protein LOC133779124 [Humulus lupulus]